MFDNIGSKIQILAKVIFVLGILAAVGGILIEVLSSFSYDGLMIAGGAAAAFVLFCSSWILYAFGQITNDVHRLSERAEQTFSDEDEIPDL